MRSAAKRFGMIMSVLTLLAIVAEQARAAPVSIAWTGPTDGDNMTINFAGFSANQLTSITGGGYAHNHGSASAVFGLDLLVDGNWITIDSTTLPSNQDVLLSIAFAGPTPFTGGTITGIRLTDSPVIGNGYHGMYSSGLASGTTTFNFDTVAASSVPEPATLALMGLGGIGLFGGAARKRRKSTTAA